MTSAILQIGSSRQLGIEDDHDLLEAYSHPVLATTNNGVYASLKDVPAGTAISNTTYWKKILEGGIVWQGDYVLTQSYSQHNVVRTTTGIYLVKTGEEASAGESPTTATAKWDVIFDFAITGTPNSLLGFNASGDLVGIPVAAGRLTSSDNLLANVGFTTAMAAEGKVRLIQDSEKSQCNVLASALVSAENHVLACGYYTTNYYCNSPFNTVNSHYLGRAFNEKPASLVQLVRTSDSIAVLDENGDVFINSSRNTYGLAGQGFVGATVPNKEGESVYRQFLKADLGAISGQIVELGFGTGGVYSDGYLGTLFARSDDGTLYSLGYNAYGQGGVGTNSNITTFTKVLIPAGNKVIGFAAGDVRYSHCVAWCDTGKAYQWGYLNTGRGGGSPNSAGNKNTPQEITGAWGSAKITKAYVGGSSSNGWTRLLVDSGESFFAGYAGLGQSGAGTNSQASTWVTGKKDDGAPLAQDIVDMYCTKGIYSAHFLKRSNGQWISTGRAYVNCRSTSAKNKFGDIDETYLTGTIEKMWSTASNNGYDQIFVRTDEGLFVTGYGNHYSRGDGSTSAFFKLKPMALSSDRPVIAVGNSGYDQYQSHQILHDDGTLDFCGYASNGQSGSGVTSVIYQTMGVNI